MRNTTSIEWTHEPGRIGCTWNPIRGCSRVSPGCDHCYAETIAARFSGPGLWAERYAKRTKAGARWTREVDLVPEKLAEPFSWSKPRRVFVNSMSDLFHEKLSFEEIAAVVGVMAACPQHIFMTLTKRAKRMREWFEWTEARRRAEMDRWRRRERRDRPVSHTHFVANEAAVRIEAESRAWQRMRLFLHQFEGPDWPLPNWQVGVSAEDQQRWDERVPELLRCPAAVRFVSAEPLLAPIDTEEWLSVWGIRKLSAKLSGDERVDAALATDETRIHQVIVGGESGPGARPCRVEWIRDIVRQCKAAGVACFTKQQGAYSVARAAGSPMVIYQSEKFYERDGNLCHRFKERKGGDPSEWPGGPEAWPREQV